jgi:predicted phosphodiesterase
MPTLAESAMPRAPPGSGKRSVVIVSDLHLGGNEDHGTMARFCRFLDALNLADTRPIPITDPEKPFRPDLQVDDLSEQKKPGQLYKPEKIILLGDFLECWDSRDQNRQNVLFDALFPLIRLRDMDLETVYVTGNHDEDLQDLIASGACLLQECGDTARGFWNAKIKALFEDQDAGKELHGVEIHWSDTHSLHLHGRAYAPPLSDGKHGIKKGGITYSFLHGHQFDKEQITATLDEGLSKVGAGIRCDIIDYFEDIANISAARSVGFVHLSIMFFLTLFLAILFWFNQKDLMATIGGFFGAGLICVLVGMMYIFRKKAPDLPSSCSIFWGCAGAVVVLILFFLLYCLTNLIPDYPLWLFLALFAISLYITIALDVPCIVAHGKRWVYNTFLKTGNKSIEEIVNEGTFNFKRFSHKSDVLVFGHTHKPDVCFVPSLGKKGTGEPPLPTSLLWILNTGCWVRDPNQTGENPKSKKTGPNEGDEKTIPDSEELDTFVYIDDDGVSLMSWNDRKTEVVCLYHIRNWLSKGTGIPS